jgi:hypothetical protein
VSAAIGTVNEPGTGLYELAELALEVERTADPAKLKALSAVRNLKINEVLDAGATVREIVIACGLYESTVVLVRHPERFPDYAERCLGRKVK